MNPFKFGTIVEGDFFTDRVEETAVLLQKLDSENHIVLISPRRFGKSSLVQKVLSQVDRPQIRIDLQYVMSVDDLAAQLLKAIFKIYPMEKVRHAMTHFRIAPTLSMNAVTGAMEVSFQPTANASVLLEDAMAVLEKVTTAENRFIVVLDEFQEVVKIQKGLDRQLRSLMQRQHNLWRPRRAERLPHCHLCLGRADPAGRTARERLSLRPLGKGWPGTEQIADYYRCGEGQPHLQGILQSEPLGRQFC
jgi:AAA+ ATPase superfamily predicted ATPase